MSDVISRGSCPGEELCPRIDALDADQARAALRYLALGLGGPPADADEIARAVRHGERWHEGRDAS